MKNANVYQVSHETMQKIFRASSLAAVSTLHVPGDRTIDALIDALLMDGQIQVISESRS